MTFHWIDLSVVAGYFALIFFVGFVISSRRKKGATSAGEEYILAGRGITLPFFVATLVATWYGNIFGIGEFVYSGGIVAWVCFGFPYYISAFLFAFLLAKKIRQSDVKTIPEQITSRYGEKAGYISSFIVLIITVPAAYILMLGVIVQLFTGWALWMCVVFGAIVSMIYLYTGGFRADVLTNTAQFVIMYIGFGVLLIFSILKYGMPSMIAGKLPASHLTLFGGYSWQVIATWFIISLQTFVDPSFHQRCAAAKTPGTAKNGILVSVAFWVLFDMLTLITGLYSRAAFNSISPMSAYTILGENVLPVFWKGFFVVSLMATVMSSLDSYAFISAVTIGNDILKKFKIRIFNGEDSTKALIRIGLIVTAIICVILALSLPSALQLIYKTSSIAIPGLLIPLTLSFFRKYYLTKKGAIIIMLVSSGISLIWTTGRFLTDHFTILGKLFWEVEPMLAGISISFVLAVLLVRKAAENE
jgi:SSS family solute:Na+ symporter